MLWPLVVNRDCLSRILLAPTAQSRSCHYGAGAYSVDERTQVHVAKEVRRSLRGSNWENWNVRRERYDDEMPFSTCSAPSKEVSLYCNLQQQSDR